MATAKTNPQKVNIMKLCDLHTHVLPGVDDGAQTMEYALQMLENAAASDVQLLAVTPHCNVPFAGAKLSKEELAVRFSQLQKAAKNIPVQLVLGAEVRFSDDLPQLLQQRFFPTINGSRYLLTEFSPNTEAEDFSVALQSILDCGYTPIVAHPERYAAVCRNAGIVLPWLDMGCHLQLTGGSIMGVYGQTVQQTAATLLRHDLVACVASDAHGVTRRSNFLLDVYDHLTVQYTKVHANCLMYENPLRICRDEIL